MTFLTPKRDLVLFFCTWDVYLSVNCCKPSFLDFRKIAFRENLRYAVHSDYSEKVRLYQLLPWDHIKSKHQGQKSCAVFSPGGPISGPRVAGAPHLQPPRLCLMGGQRHPGRLPALSPSHICSSRLRLGHQQDRRQCAEEKQRLNRGRDSTGLKLTSVQP